MYKVASLIVFGCLLTGCSSKDIQTFQKIVEALEEHEGQQPPAPTPSPGTASGIPVLAIPDATISSEAPIIQAGDFLPKALWNDPSVQKESGQYVMYMTTSTVEPFEPPILPFRATSTDGVSWQLSSTEPLLTTHGGPYASIETPSVVQFGGQYHMFFTGVYPAGGPSPMSIGHAVSTDGLTWQVEKWERLKAVGGTAWNGYLVGEPGAVVADGKLMVFFSAVGARAGHDVPLQTIGVIQSTDGQTFTQPTKVLEQGEMYPVSQGYAGYSSPSANYENGKVHLFYSVVNVDKNQNPEWQQVAIHHAKAAPHTLAFTEDSAALINRPSTSWTSGEVLAPSVLNDAGTAKMWFGGHVKVSELAPLINRGIKGPEFGIGYATAPAGSIFNP